MLSPICSYLNLKMMTQTMIFLLLIVWARIEPGYTQQVYDPTDCSSFVYQSGSRYTCNSIQDHCETFIVYRASRDFQNISTVAKLFNMDLDKLLQLNEQLSTAEILNPGQEIIVPIGCSCSRMYYQASFNYTVRDVTALTDIACGVFEGLVKSKALVDENPNEGNNLKVGSSLHVPIKCACPPNSRSSTEFKYFMTYPLITGDEPNKLGIIFGIPPNDIFEANGLNTFATVYPSTTLLIPLRSEPKINYIISGIPPPPSSFLPTITERKAKISSKLSILFIAGSITGFLLAAFCTLACIMYVKALNKRKHQKFYSFTARGSPLSGCTATRSSPRSCVTARSSTATPCLSPDLLVGIKYSLHNYSIGELKRATDDFSEDARLDYPDVFKGLLDGKDEVTIQQMRFEDTHKVIDLHVKINHINVAKLLGACYGSDIASWSYLVFEFPSNGCLRDRLRNNVDLLDWKMRTQVAFDTANGLHYLHYCTFPSYNHISINRRNIFITSECRAKLTTFRTPSMVSSKEIVSSANCDHWLAPEYIQHGTVSEKVDIFAFGVVLLQLISAKEDPSGSLSREITGFLGGGDSNGGCFEQLRSFIDPRLNGGYSLAEAFCLAVLAKACVEDDPLHRPSMDDILKVLARMV